MLEFPTIEDLQIPKQLNDKPIKETDLLIENKEVKEELPNIINAKFEINPDGLIDIETKYGELKNVPKDYLPDDFKNKKNGEFKISFIDHDIIAKKMLNQLLNTHNENE